MSRHKCTRELYRAFLQASSIRYSGLALSEVSPVALSHDSVSRWLESQHFRPREIWKLVREHVHKDEPCLLIADDTILDKHRSQKIELVHYQYSGNEHNVIPGIGLLNMLWHGMYSECSIPIDYRIYDKDTDGKTKNDHLREMLKLSSIRCLEPEAVVMDTWYSSLGNLKAIRDLGWIWVAGLKKNRKVNHNEDLETLEFTEEGLKLHLRGYGWITVFKFVAANGRIDYIGTNMEKPLREDIETIVRARWKVEVYHRELKQTCGIESCQARTGRAQRNHIFLAIAAWFEAYKRRCYEQITPYQLKWDVIKGAVTSKMKDILLAT